MSRYSRRQLYQAILRRLLRWRFARHKLRASEEDADLGSLEIHVERMPTFNESELTALERNVAVPLGGVAWKCMLNECQLLTKMTFLDRNDFYLGVGGQGFVY